MMELWLRIIVILLGAALMWMGIFWRQSPQAPKPLKPRTIEVDNPMLLPADGVTWFDDNGNPVVTLRPKRE